jgi:hypothetical protein
MGDEKKRGWILEMDLPGACSADLRGRQSVRATFRLSSACIDAISVVARHLGIKQKSLFDHLTEDTASLTAIAREAGDQSGSGEGRIQKTFVLSRRSLCSLEQVSKSYNTPRDFLVECSVQRLLPLIENERLRQQKRREMLSDIRKHFRKGALLLEKWEEKLGGPDPFLDGVAAVMGGYGQALEELEEAVEQGRIIETLEL